MDNFRLYYQSCLDLKEIEAKSDAAFVDYTRNELGEWPMLRKIEKPNANEPFEIEKFLAKLSLFQSPIVFRFVNDDFNCTHIMMRFLVPADFCSIRRLLPKNQTEKIHFTKFLKNLNKHLRESSDNLKSVDDEELDRQINEMLELAKIIYFLNDEKYNCRNSGNLTENIMTIGELNRFFASDDGSKVIDFAKFVSYLDESNKLVNANTSVVVKSGMLNYLKDLFAAFRNEMHTNGPKFERSFRNFGHIHLILDQLKTFDQFYAIHTHTVLPIRYYHELFEYQKLRFENEQIIKYFKIIYSTSRQEVCAQAILNAFTTLNTHEMFELQKLFLTQKFDMSKKEYTKTMVEHLLQVINEFIQSQNWLSESLKISIIDLMKSLKFQIAYSDSLFAHSSLDHVQDYNLTSHYIINQLEINRHGYREELNLLHLAETQSQRIRSDNWKFNIFFINALTLLKHKTILIPAGILMEPIFNKNLPQSLNHASISAIIAHEIWHIIHYVLQFENVSQNKYQDILDCLAHEYEDFVYKKYGLKIDGRYSLEELAADHFSIALAHKLHMKEKSASKSSNSHAAVSLPGLAFNDEQLFFIKYAQKYCAKTSTFSQRDFEREHPVNAFRIHQVSLWPEFSKAFKCDSRTRPSESNTKRMCGNY